VKILVISARPLPLDDGEIAWYPIRVRPGLTRCLSVLIGALPSVLMLVARPAYAAGEPCAPSQFVGDTCSTAIDGQCEEPRVSCGPSAPGVDGGCLSCQAGLSKGCSTGGGPVTLPALWLGALLLSFGAHRRRLARGE
jgi:hypothetical protein